MVGAHTDSNLENVATRPRLEAREVEDVWLECVTGALTRRDVSGIEPHRDVDVAVRAGFRGPIAHGMLLIGFVDEMLSNVAASVPVVRFSAWPVPLSVTSAIVSVPKLVPLMSVKEFPPVKPRSVLPEATLIELLALVMLTIIAFPLLVAGNGSL